jgi:hypothetical protein
MRTSLIPVFRLLGYFLACGGAAWFLMDLLRRDVVGFWWAVPVTLMVGGGVGYLISRTRLTREQFFMALSASLLIKEVVRLLLL